MSADTYQPHYVDIGINLADPIFRGVYHGRQRHENDLPAVIERAREVGCTKLIVTGSDFKSIRDGFDLCKEFPGVVYSTVGIHPCSSSIFGRVVKSQNGAKSEAPCAPSDDETPRQDEPDDERTSATMATLGALLDEARDGDIKSGLVAFGEFGLDYDRLHYCSRAVQLHSFRTQLDLVVSMKPGTQLPLFLHSRAAHADFVRLLQEKFGSGLEGLERGGVVHSFTGTMAEMKELTALGLYIGINGCSLKTAENCEVVKEIPLDRLMLETDGPWCGVRPSHEGWKYLVQHKADTAPASSPDAANPSASVDGAVSEPSQRQAGSKKGKQQQKGPDIPERWRSVAKEKWVPGAMVKGRNEPCMIERVATIVAAIKDVSIEDVCEAAWRNTVKVFRVGCETADGRE